MANIEITGDPQFAGANLADSPETCVNAGKTLQKLTTLEIIHDNTHSRGDDLAR